MGTWNFRIVKKGHSFGVHSAYYNDEGKLDGLSVDPAFPVGEDLGDLEGNLKLFLEAFQDPVIDYETLKPLEMKP